MPGRVTSDGQSKKGSAASNVDLPALLRALVRELEIGANFDGQPNRLGDIGKLLRLIAEESKRLAISPPIRLEGKNLIVERTPWHEINYVWGVVLSGPNRPQRLMSNTAGHVSILIGKVQNWVDYLSGPENRTPLVTTLLDMAREWAQKRQKDGGPTPDQLALVEYLIECDGKSVPQDIGVAIGKKWKDVRRSCRQLVMGINGRLEKCNEHWRLVPEDRGEVVIVHH